MVFIKPRSHVIDYMADILNTISNSGKGVQSPLPSTRYQVPGSLYDDGRRERCALVLKAFFGINKLKLLYKICTIMVVLDLFGLHTACLEGIL